MKKVREFKLWPFYLLIGEIKKEKEIYLKVKFFLAFGFGNLPNQFAWGIWFYIGFNKKIKGLEKVGWGFTIPIKRYL